MSLENKLMCFYYNSLGRVILGIERTKQLCVQCMWLVHFLGHVVDVVRPIVKHLGDDEGAFLGRSKACEAVSGALGAQGLLLGMLDP